MAKERALDFIYGEDLGAVSPEHVMPLLLIGRKMSATGVQGSNLAEKIGNKQTLSHVAAALALWSLSPYRYSVFGHSYSQPWLIMVV